MHWLTFESRLGTRIGTRKKSWMFDFFSSGGLAAKSPQFPVTESLLIPLNQRMHILLVHSTSSQNNLAHFTKLVHFSTRAAACGQRLALLIHLPTTYH
eukprot:m.147236 g.147236  ORF g.147236 m.147236 type:complete len:98 (+) comp14162_c3_seq3:177-470(+)